MTNQFTLWMTEIRQHMTPAPGSTEIPVAPAPGLPDREPNEQHAHPMDQPILSNPIPNNDRLAASTPTRQQAKRTDTQTTPWRDHMELDLIDMQVGPTTEHVFPPLHATQSSPLLLLTQETPPPQSPRSHEGKRPCPILSPPSPPIESPPLSPFQDHMATLLAAQASPPTPPGYHSDEPQYVYDYHDGGLICAGIAQQSDYYSDGSL